MTNLKASRLNSILTALLNCAGEVGCTRREIAGMLIKPDGTPLKKTPYITQLLTQCVADGFATEEMDNSVWPHVLRYKPTALLVEQHSQPVTA